MTDLAEAPAPANLGVLTEEERATIRRQLDLEVHHIDTAKAIRAGREAVMERFLRERGLDPAAADYTVDIDSGAIALSPAQSAS